MTIATVKLPPGMFRNGTPYSAKNRWVDGNLVRWHDGSLRPIGGWRLLAITPPASTTSIVIDPATETIRDAKQWRDNTGNTVQVLASNSALYSINGAGDVINVTPVGFTGGSNQPSVSTGYGVGPYNTWEYGTSRPTDNTAKAPVYRWDMSLWGEDLLLCPQSPTDGGTLYTFDSSNPGPATPVANAPTDVSGVLATDERICMVIGSDTEPRRVRWSTREDNTVWTPDIQNEAGAITLQGNGKLLHIKSVLNQILILSESDAHVGRYVGAPFIYGFERVGDGCGPLAGDSVIVTDRFAIWPSSRTFYMFDGTVREVKCDVMDFLVNDFSVDNASKMVGVSVPEFSEIWWFYQSIDSVTGDVDSYVAFDYVEQHWSTGKLGRTAAYGGEGTQPLLMVDYLSNVYQHEIAGVNVEGAFAETGPLELAEGEKNMAVRYIFPDTQSYGDVTYTLYGRAMPTEPEYVYGPYAYANPVSTRAMGREIRMRCEGLARWEVGDKTRFDVAPTGTGMR